ncbi:putative fatty acid hydroxylase [Arabidopsis thaliana]
MYLVNNKLPGCSRIPPKPPSCASFLLHAVPVEFLYYWFHRSLHHHFLYSRYHSHHHSSIVTEPITSVVHPFAEHIAYSVLFAIPIVTASLCGILSIVPFVAYVTYIDFMNYMGHYNFEFFPKRLFHHSLSSSSSATPPRTFHSLHHTQFRTNYSLFIPIYDHIYGTTHKCSESLYEKSLEREEESPDVINLTHLTTLDSIYQMRLGFPSLSSRPLWSRSPWYLTYFMWPFTVLFSFVSVTSPFTLTSFQSLHFT